MNTWEDFFALVKHTRAAYKDYFNETNGLAKMKKQEIYEQLGSDVDALIRQHEQNREKAMQLSLERMFDGKVVSVNGSEQQDKP